MNIATLNPILLVLGSLGKDELVFLKQYIESTLSGEVKDIFHTFIDAQVKFIEEEFKNKI